MQGVSGGLFGAGRSASSGPPLFGSLPTTTLPGAGAQSSASTANTAGGFFEGRKTGPSLSGSVAGAPAVLAAPAVGAAPAIGGALPGSGNTLFGSASQKTPLFGGRSTASSGNSLFGSASVEGHAAARGGSSLFEGHPQGSSATETAHNLFGWSAAISAGGGLFGGAPKGPTSAATGSSLFGSATGGAPAAASGGSGLFGGASDAALPQSSLFGSVVGGGSSAATPGGSGFFGGATKGPSSSSAPTTISFGIPGEGAPSAASRGGSTLFGGGPQVPPKAASGVNLFGSIGSGVSRATTGGTSNFGWAPKPMPLAGKLFSGPSSGALSQSGGLFESVPGSSGAPNSAGIRGLFGAPREGEPSEAANSNRWGGGLFGGPSGGHSVENSASGSVWPGGVAQARMAVAPKSGAFAAPEGSKGGSLMNTARGPTLGGSAETLFGSSSGTPPFFATKSSSIFGADSGRLSVSGEPGGHATSSGKPTFGAGGLQRSSSSSGSGGPSSAGGHSLFGAASVVTENPSSSGSSVAAVHGRSRLCVPEGTAIPPPLPVPSGPHANPMLRETLAEGDPVLRIQVVQQLQQLLQKGPTASAASGSDPALGGPFVGQLYGCCSNEEMLDKQQVSTASDFERLDATVPGDPEARIVSRQIAAS